MAIVVNFNKRKSSLSQRQPRPEQSFRPLEADFDKHIIPDVVNELTRNSHLYTVNSKSTDTDWITIYHLPMSVANTFSFIRSMIERDRPPGLRTFICMALTHGIDIFKSNENVAQLLLINDKMFRHRLTCEPEETFIIDFLRMPIQLTLTQRGNRVNVPVTQWVKEELSNMYSEMGVDLSTLAVMCLYSYLVTQDEYIPQRQIGEWNKILEAYIKVVKIKAKGVEAMMRIFYGY